MFISMFFVSLFPRIDSVSISDARAQADIDDTRYTVSGQVTSVPGVLKDFFGGENGYGFTLQDDTGGIVVYVPEMSYYDSQEAEFTIGREVSVTGMVDSNTGPIEGRDEGGTIRINPNGTNDIMLVMSTDAPNPYEPIVIDPDQVKDYQGQLVQIQNVNISHLIVASKYGIDYRAVSLEDSDKATSIWFYNNTYWESKSFVIVGEQYEYITGIAAVFIKFKDSHELEEFWEIWPRSEDDWMVLESVSVRNKFVYGFIVVLLFTMFVE